MIPLEFVKTLGIPISRLTMEEVICLVEEWLVSKAGKKRIVTVNPEFLVLSYYNREFESILRKADLAVPDGVGILTAAQYSFYMRSLPNSKLLCLAGSFFYGIVCGLALLFCPAFFKVLKERITGVDLVGNLCQKSREQGWRVFLLGGWWLWMAPLLIGGVMIGRVMAGVHYPSDVITGSIIGCLSVFGAYFLIFL